MDNENSAGPIIMVVMFIIIGGIVAWGFATGWTFSGMLSREGAKCIPKEDDKDENAKSYVYDDDENCIIKTCKEDWEPDESNTACISSLEGTSCEFEGTKIDKGVYKWSSTNACEISSCTGNFKLNSAKTACDTCETGYTLTDGSCVASPSPPPDSCAGKTLDNAGDVDTAETCNLLTKNKVCYKVSGTGVVEKTLNDFTDYENARQCFPDNAYLYFKTDTTINNVIPIHGGKTNFNEITAPDSVNNVVVPDGFGLDLWRNGAWDPCSYITGNIIAGRGKITHWNVKPISDIANDKFCAPKCTSATEDCLIVASYVGQGPANFTHPSGYNLVMKDDGNLVIHNKDNKPTWTTATNGKGANKYVMQGDGNLVLYNKDSEDIWDSNNDNTHSMNPTRNYSLDTSKAPYGLYMNRYGELTIKDKDKNIVWRNMNNYTQVNGKIITPGLHLEMLPDDVADGLNIQGAVNEHKNERVVEGATNIFKYNLTGHPFYPDIDKLPYECRRWCDQNPECVGVVYDRNAGFAGRCMLNKLVNNKTVDDLTYAPVQHGYNYYGKTWSDGHQYQTKLNSINVAAAVKLGIEKAQSKVAAFFRS